MAEGRLQWVWFGLAAVALLAAGAFLGRSIVQQRDARQDRTRAQHDLIVARHAQSADAADLQAAQAAVGSVRDQLAAAAKGVGTVADLDQRDLDAVKAALQAGQAGERSAYNAAADQRTALDAQHDAAVEQLRQQVNAIIAALGSIS